MIELREELRNFAEAMETKLRDKEQAKGDTWKTCPVEYLEERLEKEMEEFLNYEGPEELIDIANFAMFIWNRKKE